MDKVSIFRLQSPWKSWFLRSQVAGYQTTYARDGYSLKHATIKGAGHVVALSKPEEALFMVNEWLYVFKFLLNQYIIHSGSVPPTLPGVLWVLPDSYLDVPNKDYGGDLFIDGKVIPRPQYRFADRQQNTRPRPRPRYDKRRETMQTIRREPVQGQGWAQQPAGQAPSQNAGGGSIAINMA
nr:multiple organellar RNA editing factor 3, mitochondrial [Tanacetum cinerariifolium]